MKTKMRVWWMPQVGASNARLHVPVTSVEEAAKILYLLAMYDAFQWNHGIKDDYCNTGGLEVWDNESQEWIGWETEDNLCVYNDPVRYIAENHATLSYNDFMETLREQVNFR